MLRHKKMNPHQIATFNLAQAREMLRSFHAIAGSTRSFNLAQAREMLRATMRSSMIFKLSTSRRRERCYAGHVVVASPLDLSTSRRRERCYITGIYPDPTTHFQPRAGARDATSFSHSRARSYTFNLAQAREMLLERKKIGDMTKLSTSRRRERCYTSYRGSDMQSGLSTSRRRERCYRSGHRPA